MSDTFLQIMKQVFLVSAYSLFSTGLGIHSFIQHICLEQLPYAKHCSYCSLPYRQKTQP